MLDEAEDRYEGGVEEVSKPKFDYKKFFKKRYADGGAIGIEVLFEPKRKDFNIGGNVQRVTTPQPYDPRASATDFARAIDTVGAGTNMQKAKAIQSYDQNVQRQNMVNRIQKMNPAGTGNFLQGIKDFGQHAMVSEAMAGKTGMPVIPEYGFQTGYDFQKKFTGLDPKISAGLAAAYQTLQEGSRALLDGPGGITLGQAMKTAQQQATENMEGILAADTGTITPEQQAARDEYLEKQGQPTEPVIDQDRISEIVEQQKAAGVPDEGLITNFNKPTMADVAGPATEGSYYLRDLGLDGIDDASPFDILKNYLKINKDIEPYQVEKNRIGPNNFIGSGGYETFNPYSEDFDLERDYFDRFGRIGYDNPNALNVLYNPESGELLRYLKDLPSLDPDKGPGGYQYFSGKRVSPDTTNIQSFNPVGGGFGDYGTSRMDFKNYGPALADGGRVGLFMGGDPLTGQALAIYDSMKAYNFSDQEIANALSARGLSELGTSNTQDTTSSQTIGYQNNSDGKTTSIAPGTLKSQYQANINNPINNAIYDFKENMTTKLSDPTTKIGKLGINASNILGSAIGAVAGIPGLGFVLDALGSDSKFDRGAIRELNAPMQLGIYNKDRTGTGYFSQGPIQPGMSSLSDTYKSGLTDGKFAGVTVDDLGRIQQTGDYNTAENVMAGYNAGFDLGGTAFDRYDKIDDTIEKEKKKANVNYAKIKSLQKRQQALTDFALANAAAQRAAKQAAIDRAIARGDKEAEDRARIKSITAGYGGHDESPGATGPTAAGAGMGIGGGYASDYGFLKDGGLATMFKEKR